MHKYATAQLKLGFFDPPFPIQGKGHISFMYYLRQRRSSVTKFEFKDCPFFAVMKSLIEAKITAALFSGQRHSPTRRLYVNFIFMQTAFTVSLCVLRMYTLLYAYEKSPLVYT